MGVYIVLFSSVIHLLLGDVRGTENSSGVTLHCGSLFACKNGYKCIPKTQLCNGANNCLDYSDEHLATCIRNGVVPAQESCETYEYKCKNGFNCVYKSQLCDGRDNCGDFSDEDPSTCLYLGRFSIGTKCSDVGFECVGDGKCISRRLLCNGINDCGDNTDEDIENCRRARQNTPIANNLTCSKAKFKCKNGLKCITKGGLCNSYNDCIDGSDEDPSECIKEGILPDGATCSDLGFECRNATFGGSFCVGNLFVCDGRDNCGDNSDEDPAICSQKFIKPKIELLPWYIPPEPNSTDVRTLGSNQFRCGDGRLTTLRYLCDGKGVCSDGSDQSPATCANRIINGHCKCHQWRCPNFRKCIDKKFICDGDDDCGDGSDEDVASCLFTTTMGPMSAVQEADSHDVSGEACRSDQFQVMKEWGMCQMKQGPVSALNLSSTQGTSSCPEDEFQCKDGECVPMFYTCDGHKDCTDFSDEFPSLCASQRSADSTPDCELSSEFLCRGGRSCIPQEELCDGKPDCDGSSDEDTALCEVSTTSMLISTTTSTGPLLCSMKEFKCANGLKCVPKENKCDEKDDCSDGSDESYDMCVHGGKKLEIDEDLGSSIIPYLLAIAGGIVLVILIACGAKFYCRRRRMPLEYV